MIDVHDPAGCARFHLEDDARTVARDFGLTDVRYDPAEQLWSIYHEGHALTNLEVATGEIGAGNEPGAGL